jgi:hypothetical protein
LLPNNTYMRYRDTLLKAAEALVKLLNEKKELRSIIRENSFSKLCRCSTTVKMKSVRVMVDEVTADPYCRDDLIATCIMSLTRSQILRRAYYYLILGFSFSALAYALTNSLIGPQVPELVKDVLVNILTPLPFIGGLIEYLLSFRRGKIGQMVNAFRMLKETDNLCREAYFLVSDFIGYVASGGVGRRRVSCKDVLNELRSKHAVLVRLAEQGMLKTH